MIGNDVVDLRLARKESNWKRAGFLDKIFTQDEQLLISSSDNPENMVWNLWSRKEAAYKIYNRQTQIRGYFPIQLECSNTDFTNEYCYGKVRIKDRIYFTKTIINSQFINTIAVVNVSDFESFQVLDKDISIQKIDKLPFYLNKEDSVLKAVSISHHGRFKQIVCL